jgi:hypothetical protein
MGPMNAYKDMLDNAVSPITCVSMNHQNQLEQMANGAMFAAILKSNGRCLYWLFFFNTLVLWSLLIFSYFFPDDVLSHFAEA